MAARKKKNEINLLPQEEFAASTLGRVLTWLLSTFRIIVISTEMIVMIAFLSRFYFDARNTDLTEEINQKKALIADQVETETNFRAAQKSLAIFSSLTEPDKRVSPIVQSVVALMPPDVSAVSITVNSKEVQVKGQSGSEQSIAQFMANLDESATFSEVFLTQADAKEGATVLTFIVRATLGGGALANQPRQ